MTLPLLSADLSQLWLTGSQSLANVGNTLGLRLDSRQWVQLGLLALVGVWFYWQVVRRSRSIRLFKGIFMVLCLVASLFLIAFAFRLTLLMALLGFSIQVLVFTSIVVFQPELRRMLSQLGQTMASGPNWLDVRVLHDDVADSIDVLVKAADFLGKSRTGALLVLEAGDGAAEHFLESGTQLDARISMELLLTLFHPRTPLHDGAAVIDRRNRLRSAGVLLPLTEDPKLSWQYGTRHRAALGITEVSDSACLVVSEETGQISWAVRGVLEKLPDKDALRRKLSEFYNITVDGSEDEKPAEAQGFKAKFMRTLPMSAALLQWVSQTDQP